MAVRFSGFAPARTASSLPRESRSACRWAFPRRSTARRPSPSARTRGTRSSPTSRPHPRAARTSSSAWATRWAQRSPASRESTCGASAPATRGPVVRGLDNDRVLILENGAVLAISPASPPTTACTLDPATATPDRRCVRGPATLLYGSSAIGGVVDLVSDEIVTRPLQGVHGAFTAAGRDRDDNAGIAGNLSGGNRRLAFAVNGSAQRTDEYDTPDGKVPNSQSKSKSGGASSPTTGQDGYLGASYQYVDTRYGVPFVEEGEHHPASASPPRGPARGTAQPGRIHQWRQVRRRLPRLPSTTRSRASGDIATSLHNKVTEGDLYLNHRAFGALTGTFGVRGEHRRLQRGRRGGPRASRPPRTARGLPLRGAELPPRRASVRWARRPHVIRSRTAPRWSGRTFPSATSRNFSASVGVLGHLRDDLTLALNLARAARNPSLEELYNLGRTPGTSPSRSAIPRSPQRWPTAPTSHCGTGPPVSWARELSSSTASTTSSSRSRPERYGGRPAGRELHRRRTASSTASRRMSTPA